VPGKELKNDLSEINKHVEKDNDDIKYPSRPPELGGITNHLWKSFMAPPISGKSEDVLSKMSDEEKAKLLEN
jgi:hypothetical protein